jgi:hypothetical protein
MAKRVSTMPESVKAVFAGYPAQARSRLLKIRALIFETAASTPDVGRLQETLKWGEPAYLPIESKRGSTIRIAWNAKRPDQIGVYFNCQTTLVADFRSRFGDVLRFEGNRAIVFALHEQLPMPILQHCVVATLLYHRADV